MNKSDSSKKDNIIVAIVIILMALIIAGLSAASCRTAEIDAAGAEPCKVVIYASDGDILGEFDGRYKPALNAVEVDDNGYSATVIPLD